MCLIPWGAFAIISDQSKKTIKLFAAKWSIDILVSINDFKVTGFNQLNQSLPSLSHKVLTERLQDMVKDSMISRTVVERIPLRVIYKLSPKGQAILELCTKLNDFD